METHSRILIQNCVLDILMLTCQLLIQVFYIIDTEGNEFMIFPYGILLSFMNENFIPIICNIVFVFWQYIGTINMRGLCVQFIYRYLVLNRNMEINFCRYLLMFSTVLVVQLLLSLNLSGLYMTYNVGGIKYFDDFNKTWPYIQYKIQKMNGLTLLPTIGVTIVIYLIMIICAFKMIRFVNLNTNFDGNLKRLNKLLTKVLILLAILPFIDQIGILFIIISSQTTSSTTNNIRIFIYIFLHLTPVFNPIICILTNTPYRNAIFNRSQVHPQ
uniref:Uncharacterized protein n=1 Tax=Meloidogyne enterolobii TaxID=390850 RepID=A0A6V7VHJ6_MELEN|nr:unnamed protein product [Meloidogyne enterolobii]